MPLPLCKIYRFGEKSQNNISSYLVVSTAPLNVEDEPQSMLEAFELENKDLEQISLSQAILEISEELIPSKNPVELVCAVHGYNTSTEEIKNWYRDIYRFCQKDPIISNHANTVFIGYRWPSESFSNKKPGLLQKIKQTFAALPLFPRILAILSAFIALIFTGILILPFGVSLTQASLTFVTITLVITTFILGIITCLVLLRFSLYFRDSYRAQNYAVPDLVELIRQIDVAITKKNTPEATETSNTTGITNRIRLSFLGHSMGGLVVTHVVRVLNDVFEPQAIGSLNPKEKEKKPTNEIGQSLYLGRLVLVSPDIPAETILQGRSNVLASSLRRFEESYLFSNEGDLALRLASATANYFSFPAKTRRRGFRLGTIALQSRNYGIINLQSLKKSSPESWHHKSGRKMLEKVGIGYGRSDTMSLWDSQSLTIPRSSRSVGELFTYVDCTDYTDTSTYVSKGNKKMGLLTYARNVDYLGFFGYTQLFFGYLFFNKDVHGGYFRGDYMRIFMYRILFCGMKSYLDSITPDTKKRITGFDILNNELQDKKIQVALSPERYAQIAKIKWDRDGY